ncbi:hypothetical protein Sjap_008249 [Stephania japonica]|uniref:Uncharacterized protein n=1 Tax=Stephania japonica TaxID=461633 RepID=A0AAP0JRE1_9MAGN
MQLMTCLRSCREFVEKDDHSRGVMCVRWNQLCAFNVCFGFQNINCYFITSLLH